MLKYIIGVVLIAVVATGAYYVWNGAPSEPREEMNIPSTPSQPTMATSTYATSTFSLIYPADFTVNNAYAYEGVPKKPIFGVKFSIPSTMTTGTNLSLDTGLSVESLPRAQTCTGDIYVLPNVKPIKLTENSAAYSVATTSEAGAGNFYEEYVYAFTDSSPCTAVRYFIHSTNVANYATGTVREFDRDLLIRAFDTIRRSLVLKPRSTQ